MKGYRHIPVLEIGNGLSSSIVLLLAHYVAQMDVSMAVIPAIAWFIGYRLVVGTDMTLADVFVDVRGLPPEVMSQMMSDGEKAIERLKKVKTRLNNNSLATLIDELTQQGDDIMEKLKEEPAKLPQARRFLTVYLDGLAKISEDFVHVGQESSREDLTRKYEEVLVQASGNFIKQKQSLVADDEFNLDVDIEVLQKRLAHEDI